MIGRRLFLQGSASLTSLGLIGGLSACQSRPRLRMIGEASSNLAAIKSVLPEYSERFGRDAIAEEADFTTLETQTNADFASGSGRYDIVLQYNFSLSPFVRNGYVANVQALKVASPGLDYSFEQDLLPNVWRELGYYAKPPFTNFLDAEPIAYPFAANTMVLVYNKRLLADAAVSRGIQQAVGRRLEVPRTWEELATAAKAVRQANSDYYGIALQGAGGGWLYYEWMNFLFGLGGKVMEKTYGWQSDTSTPLSLTSPEADRAAALYLSMREANAGDFFSIDAVRQRDLMLRGNVAYAIMWTDYIPELARHEMFGFAPVPGDRSMIAGGCFFVNRRSQQIADSASLIAFLLSRPIQKRMALAGLFPPTRPALEDTEVAAKPYMRAVRESLARGVYMAEAGPDSTLIQEEITSALQRAWRGTISPSQVASAAAAAITAGRIS